MSQFPSRFEPVATLEELDALDGAEILDGYTSTERDDPEPGPNRGKAFWHGWRCRMMDYGEVEQDVAHIRLVEAYCERERKRYR